MISPLRAQKLEDTDGNVLIFGAHVANLLIQRSFQSILCGKGNIPLPFIERFEGSLLFVDISGFTALSRQLHVESLKTHINAYFTKMLDVVDKYDGDVVKFAGDALYIIWPASALIDLATCVRKALLCSLEIASVCNGYIICLDESRNWMSPRLYKADEKYAANSPSLNEADNGDRFAFLNVHVGLSVGTMAAIDIGCAGRWELLLLGRPLTDVAVAENQAKSGEVVICPGAYRLLNVRRTFCADRTLRERTATASSVDLNLKFKMEPRGETCYLVQRESNFDQKVMEDDLQADWGYPTPRNRLDFVDGVLREIHSNSRDPDHDFNIWKTKDPQVQSKVLAMLMMKAHVHEAARSTAVVDLCAMAPIRSNNSSSSFQQGSPHFDFLTSGSSHGGDASPATDESKEQRDSAQDQSPSRGRMLSKKSPSSSSLTASITASMPMFPLKRGTSLIPSEPHIASSDLRKGSIPPSMLQSPTSRDGRESASNSKRFLPSDLNRMVMILTAELRKCTILFINIKVNVNLVTSPVSADRSFSESISYKKVKSLPFIARSVEEKKGDEEVLAALQKCMEITSTTLTENGGQIRQFIHDDKGTVCIGTIGLRGSTTEDNSAAAVEAARSIIAQLQDAGLDASIGVASGKAFCGLVGSSVRHEYAVMGPSVNLSARLMCAAKMGTILCDQKTMETDRRHRYVAKSAIIAKGFDAPVSIFRPLTTNVQGRSGAPGSSRVPRGRSRSPSPTRIKGIPSNSSLSSLMALAPHNRSNSKNSSSSPGHDTVNNSDDESCASTEDAFGMAFDSGLFGRASVLAKIYYFFSPDDAPFSRLNSRDDCMKKFVATVEMPTGFKGESDAPKVFSPLKMKLIIVSGPYGIGKSSVLRTIYQKVHVTSSPITSGSARFKYMTQANSYNKTTPFYVWKKILTHLLAALHFNVNKMSENDLTFSKVAYLSPVPEHKHLAVSSAAAVPPIEYFKRATINHSSKLLRSGKKKSIIAGNIHHLIKLLDPSLREMEPLLFNGFLSSCPMDHTDTTRILSSPETIKPIATLISLFIQTISDALGGPMLLVIDDVQSMDQASWAVLRHIWKHNTNLTVICSFRTFGAQNVNYESEAVSCKYPTDSKEGEINLENELTNSFVDSTSEENRLLVIELQALDEKSTLDLASRLVNEHDACVPNDNKMLEAVYKLSGGNPLYAVEVSKAAIKMVGKIESPKLLIKMAVRDSAESKFDCIDDSKKDDVIQKWAKAFQKVTASLRSERIEEVIIFRFDQLNYKSQLLLKIAAVAGFNNAPFNADVLCFILPDFSSARTQDELFNSRASMNEDSNDESDVEDQDFLSDFTQRISDEHRGESCERDYRCRAAVRKALNQILRESEFIRICKSVNESFEDGFETDHTGNDVSSRKMIESTDSMESYEFTSSLVQATILNLNLRDQNSMLHRQTATYLERQLLLKIAAATAGVSVPVVAGGVTASSGTLNSTVTGTDMSSLSSISTVSAGTVSSAQWNHMGLHWQHSSSYIKAMACFYHSAVILEKLGSSRDALVHSFKAYDMIELLRAQADCTASVLKDAYGMVAKLYGRMKGNIQRTKSSESSLFINRMCCSSSDEDPFSCSAARSPYALLTRDDICKMFQGDNLALDIAINLLITVSQNIVVTLAEHKNGDTKFYSEALELVMGSCKILLRLNSTNPTRQSSHVSLLSLVEVIPVEDTIILPKIAVLDPLIYEIATQEEREGKRKQMEKWKGKGKLKPKGSGGRRREQHGISHQFDEYQMNDDSDEEEEEGGVEDNFYIRDFTVVFPILSGLALRLLHGPTQNNEMLTKVGVLCSTFLTLTRKHGDALHIIRALHLQSIFCSRVNQVREALALCEEVTELYVFEQHSAGLNKIYGGDRGLAAIASSTVGFALVGQWTEALSLCEVIEQYLPRMTSLNQLGLIIHALGITYSILCMHDRAHHIFSILTNSESKTSAFSVLRDINPFYQEYYTRKAEKYSNDMEKERRTKLALVKDRKLLRLRLIRAALDQEMNLNSDRSRSMSRSMSMSMSDSSKDGYESNDAKNDSEVKDYNSPTASQSFSTVITAVIKAAQATTWMRKMMKQKKLEYLKRSDMTNCPPDTPHDSNSELSYFIPLLAEKIAVVSMPAKTSPNSSECHSSKTSTCNSPRSSTKFPAKNSTKDSPNDSEEAAAAPADVPFDIKATIRYQISLMTGRGLDGIKAEICVLNASALMDEVDISTSLLYNSTQPLTATEYCQEGLKCVNYQIPHEYLLSKKFEPNLDLDPDFNSAHPNLVDLVHTLLVQARLLFILSKLPPEMPRCFTVPPFTSFSSPSATPPNTGRSNVSAAASPTVAMSPSSPPSTPLAASPVPIFPSHQLVINSLCGDKSTSIPTECDPIPVKPKDIRSSYTAQVDYVLRKCAALGRSANAPGATYLAGLKMIEYGLDVKYGRECLKEAMDIISTDQIERTRRRAMQTKVDKVILKFRSGSQDSFEQILLQEDINGSGSFKKELVENMDVGSERDSEREGCYLRDSVPIYHLENIPLVIDAMKALGDTS